MDSSFICIPKPSMLQGSQCTLPIKKLAQYNHCICVTSEPEHITVDFGVSRTALLLLRMHLTNLRMCAQLDMTFDQTSVG